jgi:hypothetical protein
MRPEERPMWIWIPTWYTEGEDGEIREANTSTSAWQIQMYKQDLASMLLRYRRNHMELRGMVDDDPPKLVAMDSSGAL